MKPKIQKTPRDLVAELSRAAVEAGGQYDRQGEAFEAERQAEIALLEKAIELARPGLPAVCSRVEGVPEAIHRVTLMPDLFILVDARLARAALHDGGTFVITPVEALESYELADILAALADAMKRQVAGREPSTTAATRRAERLEALAKLVE